MYTRAAQDPGAGAWLAVLAWTGLIAVASCLPAGSMARFDLHGLDRLFHVVFYAVLTALAARAIAQHGSGEMAASAGALVGSLAFGAVMEWVQGLVGRQPDVRDWAADAAGALIALGLRAAWIRFTERPR